MLTKNISPDLHSFFEATLDSDRLKLISFLTEEPFPVLDLAEKIGGNPAAIMRHLEVLVEANLVKATDQDGKTVYRFDYKKLELMARQQLSQSQNEINLSEEHQVFIQNYTRSDGSLKIIPTHLKKISPIMEYISCAFEFDAFYSEKEVSAILNRYHPDSTTLRRHLVDYGYLGRERNGSRYWRLDNR